MIIKALSLSFERTHRLLKVCLSLSVLSVFCSLTIAQESITTALIPREGIAFIDKAEGKCHINLESSGTRECDLEEQEALQVLIAQTDAVSHLSFIESGSKIMSTIIDLMTDIACGMHSKDKNCHSLIKYLTGALVVGGILILIPPTVTIGEMVLVVGVGAMVFIIGLYQFT